MLWIILLTVLAFISVFIILFIISRTSKLSSFNESVELEINNDLLDKDTTNELNDWNISNEKQSYINFDEQKSDSISPISKEIQSHQNSDNYDKTKQQISTPKQGTSQVAIQPTIPITQSQSIQIKEEEKIKVINNTIIEERCKEVCRIFTLCKEAMFLFCYTFKPNTISNLKFQIYAIDKCNNQYLKTLKLRVATECGNENHLVVCDTTSTNMKCEEVETFYHIGCSDIKFFVKGIECEKVVWRLCMKEDCIELCPFKYMTCCPEIYAR